MSTIDAPPETVAPSFIEHAELAELLHISPQTLRRWRHQQGSIFPAALKIGRRLLFDTREVKAFIERLAAAR
jgi:predicted DNA-binding transcriptional regulator AlpA